MAEYDEVDRAPLRITIRPSYDPAGTGSYDPGWGDAISKKESGGNYRAVGPVTETGDRAWGKYQIMGKNIPQWSQEVLGRPLTIQQFVNDPDAQEAIFKAKFGDYVSKYGEGGAARAWFAGERGMNNPSARDILGTSVAGYERDFLNNLGGGTRMAGGGRHAIGVPDSGPIQMPLLAPQEAAGALPFVQASMQGPAVQNAPTASPGPAKGLFDDVPVRAPDATGKAGLFDAVPTVSPPLPSSTGAPGGLGFRFSREGEAPPVPTQSGVAGRSMLRGASANWSDELQALVEAGGGGPVDTPLGPGRSEGVDKLLRGLWQYLSGDPDAAARFSEVMAREKEQRRLDEAEYPKTALAGEMAGGALMPVGGAAGAGLRQMVVQGAKIGAGVGALSGAGAGEGLGGRTVGAGVGGAVGGAAGAAIPAALTGAGNAVGFAASQLNDKVIQPIVHSFRTEKGIDKRAQNAVVANIEAYLQNLPPGEAARVLAEWNAAKQAGLPVTIGDLGGEPLQAAARSMADRSPVGRATMNRVYDDRYETQNVRFEEWINNQFNYPNEFAREQAIKAGKRADVSPQYKHAESRPAAQAMWDEGFEQMATAPTFVSAMKMAVQQAKDVGAREGFAPMKAPFNVDRETGAMSLQTTADGSRMLPNLAYWDQVKKNLDVMGAEGRQWAKILRNHLDQLVPEYATARGTAEKFFEAEGALAQGAAFVGQKKDLLQARHEFAKLSPEEQKLFQDGFLSEFMNTFRNVADRADLVKQINQNPNAKLKMEMVMGPQKFREFEANVHIEKLMNFIRNAVQGNSQTARYLSHAIQTGGMGYAGYGGYNVDPASIATGLITAGLAKRGRRVDERIARRFAELITSDDLNKLSRGINIAAKNSGIMDALRSMEIPVVRAAAEQAHNVPSPGGQ